MLVNQQQAGVPSIDAEVCFEMLLNMQHIVFGFFSQNHGTASFEKKMEDQQSVASVAFEYVKDQIKVFALFFEILVAHSD